MPMLQDLDSLAARIGQMVQLTRQIQSERVGLQTRVRSLEQERDALRDQLERRQAEYQQMAQRMDQHLSEIEAVRTQAEQAHGDLRAQASRYQSENEAIQENLRASHADTTRLRVAAGLAKDRIDMILMRLPGAPQE